MEHSQDDKHAPHDDRHDAQSAFDAALGADEGDAADGVETPADVFAVLDKLNAENAELKDKALRTLAEMENLRRRTERELSDMKVYGISNFARDMLTFADNLRRAIANVPADTLEMADPALKSFVEGIDLTERDFLSRLVRYGVKKLEPQGQKFDPNMHEALFEVPDPSVANGTVVQVVEDGYSIGERCLRPAKVGVAKGGPKG
jgi:molecular chaperone GrpE